MVNLLPEIFVAQLSTVPLLSQYREVLCEALLKENRDAGHHAPQFHPLLRAMPAALDQPLVLASFKAAWNDSLGELKTSQKKNPEYVHAQFMHTFTHKIYPLLHLHLPAPPSDPDSERKNFDAMHRFVAEAGASHGGDPLAAFLRDSAGLIFKPFDVEGATFAPIPAAEAAAAGAVAHASV